MFVCKSMQLQNLLPGFIFICSNVLIYNEECKKIFVIGKRCGLKRIRSLENLQTGLNEAKKMLTDLLEVQFVEQVLYY